MIRVAYHDDLAQVQSDTALAHLLSDEVQRIPFDRLHWWRLLAEHCALRPRIMVARDHGACAVLALTNTRHPHEFGNWYTFHFRPIVSPGADGRALLAVIARVLRRKTTRITLAGLLEEDARLLKAAFQDAGWSAFRRPVDVNHFLSVGERDFAAYIADRPGSLRTTLDRKSGKLETQVLTKFDPDAWGRYEAVYHDSWKPEEGSPAFLRAFAEAEGAAGRLRLGLVRAGDQTVAAQFWTVDHGTAYIHKLAHRESAKHLSPGTVLTAAMFRHVIDIDRVATIDFGTGDDAYKRDWMEQMRSHHRLELLRADAPGNWPILMRRGLQSLAARAKRR